MWGYSQSTGELTHDGVVIGKAYSGHGEGINNPAMEDVSMVGPLPRGSYTIGDPFTHPKTGPITMRLVPNPGTNEFGRAGFMLHGDNSQGDESASEGCIVAARPIREYIASLVEQGVDQLTVTE